MPLTHLVSRMPMSLNLRHSFKMLAVAACCLCSVPAAAQQYNAVPPSGSSGYYIPVAPQRQSGPPCGHYMTPPCPTAAPAKVHVDIPADATADEIFDMGVKAYGRKRFSTALPYFERAAEMDHTRAQAALGLMYLNANRG